MTCLSENVAGAINVKEMTDSYAAVNGVRKSTDIAI